MKNIRTFVLLSLIIISQITYAQIPQTISYQGVLTDGSGSIVANSDYTITFRLYDAASGGSGMWTEIQSVTVTNGLFNVILGSITPLNLPFDKQYWLGITIGNDEELVPRAALTSSPYSLNSHSTLAETEPGQGLTIRNLNGDPTHQFSIDGSVRHIGTGTFLGGIVAGDTNGIPGKNSETILMNKSFKKKTLGNLLAANPDIGIQGVGNSIGVFGTGSGIGVRGESKDGMGLQGKSESFYGVSGTSGSEAGVYGISNSAAGVEGHSGSGTGVIGSGIMGLWAKNSQIKVDVVYEAPLQSRFLVWDEDNIIKYRTLPPIGGFDGILQDKAFVMKAGDNEVFRVNTDGTSFHKGVETFEDDVIFKGTESKGAKLVDATGQTIAGFGRKDLETGQRIGVYGKAENPNDIAGAFDGNVEISGNLHILNNNGDVVTSFNADGTSLHTGLEQFTGGVDLPDNNTANTASTIKAGKFNQGLTQLSKINRPSFFNSIEMPELDGKSLRTISLLTNEPTIWGYTERGDGAAIFGQSTNTSNTFPANWGVNFGGGSGVVGEVRNTTSNYPGVWAITMGTGTGLLIDHQGSAGNIFIGRSSGTNQARIDKTGKGFFNGGTQTGGADLAEAFEVEGFVKEYEPGDVLVISTTSDRTVTKSFEPYSTLIAGVYATKPGVLLTERNVDDPHDDTVPMGVVGVIPTKVCGENGPINRGDLLVTSSLPGYAMKGSNSKLLAGSILGKALENFNGNGKGVIKVLVNTK